MLVARRTRPTKCAWCVREVEQPFVWLPGLRLILCPGCAVHVGQRLEEEGGDAQILEMEGLLEPLPGVRPHPEEHREECHE